MTMPLRHTYWRRVVHGKLAAVLPGLACRYSLGSFVGLNCAKVRTYRTHVLWMY